MQSAIRQSEAKLNTRLTDIRRGYNEMLSAGGKRLRRSSRRDAHYMTQRLGIFVPYSSRKQVNRLVNRLKEIRDEDGNIPVFTHYVDTEEFDGHLNPRLATSMRVLSKYDMESIQKGVKKYVPSKLFPTIVQIWGNHMEVLDSSWYYRLRYNI